MRLPAGFELLCKVAGIVRATSAVWAASIGLPRKELIALFLHGWLNQCFARVMWSYSPTVMLEKIIIMNMSNIL